MLAHSRSPETGARQQAMLRTAFEGPVREALEAADTQAIIANPDGSVWIERPGRGLVQAAGRTDHHWDRVFTAAGLATLLAVGAETGNGERSDLERALREGFGDSVSRTGERVVDRSLGVQPTIRVAAGTPVHVLVTRDLVLKLLEAAGWP